LRITQKCIYFSRTVQIDYDTDNSGRYRAKNRDLDVASEILDTSRTRVELDMELREAREVDDEELARSMRSMVRV
jgi:hypothetical protein